MTACTPRPTATVFVPPTAAPQLPTAAAVTEAATSVAVRQLTPTAAALATPTPCTNNLSFVQDLTIPDGTSVLAGQPVDKQWFVTNSGTCNWDVRYRLKLVSGEPMGVTPEQALYPARGGTQATLRIVFTAPQEPGTHQTAWQAFAPDGTPFGDAVYMQLSVSP